MLFYSTEKLYHDLRYSNDVDCTSLTILDNSRCMTAHKDMNVVMWDIIHGMNLSMAFFLVLLVVSWFVVLLLVCCYAFVAILVLLSFTFKNLSLVPNIP